jgi:hypothetical protein
MLMHLASDIILELSLEQEHEGIRWPHPWDHYPFITDGGCIWVRYTDLDSIHRDQIRRALIRIARNLAD